MGVRDPDAGPVPQLEEHEVVASLLPDLVQAVTLDKEPGWVPARVPNRLHR